MAQRTSPESGTFRSELSRLYQRRLVVDELIRSLERYAASESARPPGKAKKLLGPQPLRNIA